MGGTSIMNLYGWPFEEKWDYICTITPMSISMEILKLLSVIEKKT